MLMHVTAAVRALIRQRRAGMDAIRPSVMGDASSHQFAWLAGATGVRLGVYARDGLHTVSVAGVVDYASTDVIRTALEETFQSSPARVELDLSRVSFVDDSGPRMIARAGARARAQQLPFHVIGPAGAGFAAARPSESCGESFRSPCRREGRNLDDCSASEARNGLRTRAGRDQRP